VGRCLKHKGEVNMDLSQLYSPGLTREETFSVEGKHTAYHIGSGNSRVLSTPSMISFMEIVSHRLLSEKLPPEKLSVGIRVDVKHLAATPVQSQVRVESELVEINGSRALFRVEAWDEVEQIGAGTHQRAVVDLERFQKGVERKKSE